ncbi:hypothetical protein NF212_03035 [Parasalinivibrio latis]|uniref:transglycosylase SLT domain-containing protein n=1 Tax=Parasalinivibrio latis TaxID=2952610 RepID=UPI0030E1BF48
MNGRQRLILLPVLAALFLTGCVASPPRDRDNICEIFREKPDWYEDAVDSQDEWGTPIQVSMAIMRQESNFVADAKPPKNYVLGFIPWGRVSSAYGYAQAQDPAWEDYQRATDNGGSRTDFGDAIDFIGWYTNETHKILGISKWDTYRQYLAYHEGRGGYKRGTYKRKPQLIRVARKVENYAKRYGGQLRSCRKELEDNRSWWPF